MFPDRGERGFTVADSMNLVSATQNLLHVQARPFVLIGDQHAWACVESIAIIGPLL